VGTLFSTFALISLIYVGIGVSYLYRVIKNWPSFWDEKITAQDRSLARGAAFYLLIPPTVVLHELGHAVALWIQGREVLDWMFLGYMGAVFFEPTGGIGDFFAALLGNVVTLAIGLVCLFLPLKRPGHPIRNLVLIELGRQSLFLVLVFYPVLCLVFDGDFRTIYNFQETPIAAGITAVIHALILLVGYNVLWKKRWATRATLLSDVTGFRYPMLEQRVAADPNDFDAHKELGLMYYLANDPVRAKPHLEIAMANGRADLMMHLAFGTVLAAVGEYERARPELELARGSLRPEDRERAEIKLRELDERR
jgi:hypothetical protein